MGYDGLPTPGNNESAEITIEVRGAISKADFDEFKKKLKQCLADLAATKGGTGVTWTSVGIKKYS